MKNFKLIIMVLLPFFSYSQGINIPYDEFNVEVTSENDSTFTLKVINEGGNTKGRTEELVRFKGLSSSETELILYQVYDRKISELSSDMLDLMTKEEKVNSMFNGLQKVGAKNWGSYISNVLEPKLNGRYKLRGPEIDKEVEVKDGQVLEGGLKIGSLSAICTNQVVLKMGISSVKMLSKNGSGFAGLHDGQVFILNKIKD